MEEKVEGTKGRDKLTLLAPRFGGTTWQLGTVSSLRGTDVRQDPRRRTHQLEAAAIGPLPTSRTASAAFRLRAATAPVARRCATAARCASKPEPLLPCRPVR